MKVSIVSPLLLSGAFSVHAADSNICCTALSHALPSSYHGPSSDDFRNLTTSRWSLTAIKSPDCVITPSSARDVSHALSIISRLGCQFAVKSGGHNANPNANNIDGGVSIDLQRLTYKKLAEDRSHVTLGTGNTWGQAYKAFQADGIAFPGGICEDVGIGGLAVGGGQSVFQAAKGWVVDNILRYEIVLADGTITTASTSKNSDLFKALKGGSTNFGIVTSIDLASFDFGTMWGGEILLNLTGSESTPKDMVDNLTHALVDFVENNNRELDSGLQVISTNLRNGARIVDLSLTNTANVSQPPALEAFWSAPNKIADSTSHTSLANMAHLASVAVPKGFRYTTASVTIKNNYQALREIWDMNDATFHGLPVQGKVDWLVSLIPQPRIQKKYSSGNMMGLDDADDEIVLWLLSRWNEAGLDDIVNDARQTFVDKANTIAAKHGAESKFVYVNYAGSNQDPLCGYGSSNVEFIRQVAAKYDPKGVFQRLMHGGFKVGEASCHM